MPKKKNFPKLSPAERLTVERERLFQTTFAALYQSLHLKLSAETILDLFRAHGFDKELMELIHPETAEKIDMHYGSALDVFDGDLLNMMTDVINNQ